MGPTEPIKVKGRDKTVSRYSENQFASQCSIFLIFVVHNFSQNQSGCHEQQRLLMDCSIGSVVVIGPKAWDFYDAFCSRRATMLKADGKDILNVTIVLRGEAAPG